MSSQHILQTPLHTHNFAKCPREKEKNTLWELTRFIKFNLLCVSGEWRMSKAAFCVDHSVLQGKKSQVDSWHGYSYRNVLKQKKLKCINYLLPTVSFLIFLHLCICIFIFATEVPIMLWGIWKACGMSNWGSVPVLALAVLNTWVRICVPLK